MKTTKENLDAMAAAGIDFKLVREASFGPMAFRIVEGGIHHEGAVTIERWPVSSGLRRCYFLPDGLEYVGDASPMRFDPESIAKFEALQLAETIGQLPARRRSTSL